MVEATQAAAPSGYVPSEAERALITIHLGDAAMLDKGYNANITLKKEEAEKRTELITEIEYDFQLALNKGDYYIGKAVVNFYLTKRPEAGELFLNFQSVAIADLLINDKLLSGDNIFVD
jgi:hypothetical protein